MVAIVPPAFSARIGIVAIRARDRTGPTGRIAAAAAASARAAARGVAAGIVRVASAIVVVVAA